ncbi:cupin domain-containing protein [Nocardioides sp. cx-169]|uniref:cupin domain-containing protein n=1 Tax=Nocardioides sp. cx-169 TaxID=2899080 RepID=UPI001E472A29|nr:cupin domain-containing protein [Nocardioides sp. cx-169]MCD4532842.1 cupin domain-containing protein [Nocardioides sp. cx-169]
MTLTRTLLVPAAAVALVASGVGVGWSASADQADRTDPADRAAAPVVVVRELLAEDRAPRGSADRTLGLNRVTVMPGAELASHHHPGTQISYVESGVLTYTVETSSTAVRTGPSDDPRVVRRIAAGQTARLRAGQWIVEQPNMTHHAANRGTTPVVLYISTLFRTGTSAAIPD